MELQTFKSLAPHYVGSSPELLLTSTCICEKMLPKTNHCVLARCGLKGKLELSKYEGQIKYKLNEKLV